MNLIAQKLQDIAIQSNLDIQKQKKVSAVLPEFSQKTVCVEKSYLSLQDGFNRINEQLEETNRHLHIKINELNALVDCLNNILNHISQGVLFINLNGIVTIFNNAASNILDKEKDSILMNPFESNFADGIFGFSMQETLSNRISPNIKFCSIKDKNDHEKKLQLFPFFTLKDNFNTQGMFLFIDNVTNIHQLEVQKNRDHRMKELGKVTTSIAHEIRNPLGGIEGFASLLKRDLENSPEQQQMASQIIEGTRSLNQIVDNVLNYARPLELKLKNSNLIVLVKKSCQWLSADFKFPQKIKLYVSAKSQNIFANIDESLIRSAIFDLIKNAVDAMPNGGQITIKISDKIKFVSIEVHDQGKGISESDLENIFHPFFTTKKGGNGLGLSFVHKIITAHKGAIKTKSVVGEGTSFLIKLPKNHG